MNNVETVPDISWTWDDQKTQEILSGERWPKIFDDMYTAKVKWYKDSTLFLTIVIGIIARLACGIFKLNIFLIFIIYSLILIWQQYAKIFAGWPSHGYLWDLYTYTWGVDDKFSLYIGRIADVATLILNHLTLFLLTFILLHIYL